MPWASVNVMQAYQLIPLRKPGDVAGIQGRRYLLADGAILGQDVSRPQHWSGVIGLSFC